MSGDRIRVLHLIYRFDVEGGGIGRFATALSRALDPQCFFPAICALGNTGTPLEAKWERQLNEDGIPAFSAAVWDDAKPYRGFASAYRALQFHLRETPADIVHSHSEFTDVAALLLKLQGLAPRIMRTVHYGFQVEWRKHPLRRYIFTYFLYPLLYDRETAVSPSLAENLNRRWFTLLRKRPALYIPNAVEAERFENASPDCTEVRRSLGAPVGVTLIGAVGRLTEQKGYPYLIGAVPLVLEELLDAWFVLVGDGEDRSALEAQAASLGVQDRVIFAGLRSDIEQIYPCLDLFVSSSLWEGLPTVVMESMLAGTPVVGTDIPGTRDLVQDGMTGWLSPAGDEQALAKGIISAVRSPEERLTRAARARETVKQYTIPVTAARFAQLYREIAKHG